MKHFCMYCRHSGKIVGYHHTGRSKRERIPILKCEKYLFGVVCTELRECFEPEPSCSSSDKNTGKE